MSNEDTLPKAVFAKALYAALCAAGVKWLRYVTCDVSNQIRAKAIHIDTREIAEDPEMMLSGIGFVACLNGLPGYGDHIVYRTAQGLDYLIGDFGTLSVLPYNPSHAVVYGTLEVSPGVPSPLCPRNFLQKQINIAEEKSIFFNFGVEMECIFLKDGKPTDNTNYCSSRGIDINTPLIEDVVRMLALQPNTCPAVQMIHAEAAPGQVEFVIRYCQDPMKIADAVVTIRETVHAVARKHGITATFLPKPFTDAIGSGMHLHISYSTCKNGPSVLAGDGKYGMTETGGQLLMGVLQNLQGLVCITQPTVNSYKRMLPGYWSGSHQCWGIEHKEASVRVCLDQRRGVPVHFELKTSDATANPYLAIGSVIACALSGLEQQLDMTEPIGAEVTGEMLPTTLEGALEQLENNPVLREALGEDLFECFLAVKRDENRYFKENEELVFTLDPY